MLAPLRAHGFEPGDWSYAPVANDCHVRFEPDGHGYSLAYANVGDDFDVPVSEDPELVARVAEAEHSK